MLYSLFLEGISFCRRRLNGLFFPLELLFLLILLFLFILLFLLLLCGNIYVYTVFIRNRTNDSTFPVINFPDPITQTILIKTFRAYAAILEIPYPFSVLLTTHIIALHSRLP